MDFSLSAEERAVIDAVEALSGAGDPWSHLESGGWLEVARSDVALAGLVGETLGRNGIALPYVASGVVLPLLLDADQWADTDAGRVAVALDDLVEDGAGAGTLIVLEAGSATVHRDFTLGAVGGLEGDGLSSILELGPVAMTINDPERLHRVRLASTATAAAELAGHLRRAFELTTTHVSVREQFGRPLAHFQVVRHGLARLFGLAEAGTWLARTAVATLDEFTVNAAKAWVSRTSVEVSSIAYQLHGATGFTREYPLQASTKRMRQLRFAWGGERAALVRAGVLRRNTTGSAW